MRDLVAKIALSVRCLLGHHETVYCEDFAITGLDCERCKNCSYVRAPLECTAIEYKAA